MVIPEDIKLIKVKFREQFVKQYPEYCSGCGLRFYDRWYLVLYLIKPLGGDFQVPHYFENLPIITEVTGPIQILEGD